MLTEQIGINAGLVWNALQNGALASKAIKKLTKLNEKDLQLALGWLAREGKISLTETESEVLISLV